MTQNVLNLVRLDILKLNASIIKTKIKMMIERANQLLGAHRKVDRAKKLSMLSPSAFILILIIIDGGLI